MTPGEREVIQIEVRAWSRSKGQTPKEKHAVLKAVLDRLGIQKVSAVTTVEQIEEIRKAINAPKLKPRDIIQKAIETILELGPFDGAHHKQWALDQTLRVLAGDRYGELIREFCAGDLAYEWSEGIAP